QWTIEALAAMTPAQRLDVLLPVDAALTQCRRLDLPAGGVGALRQGQAVAVAAHPPADAAPGIVRIYAEGLGFLGLGQIEAMGRLVPLRLISSVS
ncbi:MAG: tRNA pseudouridine(55) synthase TruB, partial [Pseudomonadota bacterium]|nr:tRNA pseudouridine(55) synthase TruB [Pseudomonadota bacterium]